MTDRSIRPAARASRVLSTLQSEVRLVFQPSSIAGHFRFPGMDQRDVPSTKRHLRGTCVAVARTTQSNRAARPRGATTRVHSAARGYDRCRRGTGGDGRRHSARWSGKGGPDSLTQKRVESRSRWFDGGGGATGESAGGGETATHKPTINQA